MPGGKAGPITVDKDEHPRLTSLDKLAGLKDAPGSLYNEADASMEKSEGLNPVSSQGYVEIQAVEAKALARAGQIKL